MWREAEMKELSVKIAIVTMQEASDPSLELRSRGASPVPSELYDDVGHTCEHKA